MASYHVSDQALGGMIGVPEYGKCKGSSLFKSHNHRPAWKRASSSSDSALHSLKDQDGAKVYCMVLRSQEIIAWVFYQSTP